MGTPTEIYSRVAQGALRCWFGSGGPLKATHIFNAEAAPPSEGGAAEIVVHERDDAHSDRRGARAFRVAFAAQAGSVRVGITRIRIEGALAELMARDVEVWSQGGGGCLARALALPSASPAPAPRAPSAKPGSTKSSRTN
jgi:hypothetical protein